MTLIGQHSFSQKWRRGQEAEAFSFIALGDPRGTVTSPRNLLVRLQEFGRVASTHHCLTLTKENNDNNTELSMKGNSFSSRRI